MSCAQWTAYPSGAHEFTPVYSGVHVTWSLVLCDRCLSLCPFSFGHCVVYPSLIYLFDSDYPPLVPSNSTYYSTFLKFNLFKKFIPEGNCNSSSWCPWNNALYKKKQENLNIIIIISITLNY